MEIEINDVLVALTSEPTAVGLPAERGVDEDSVRAAIERRGTFEQPPEASATPTCGCDDVRVFERSRSGPVGLSWAQTEARILARARTLILRPAGQPARREITRRA